MKITYFGWLKDKVGFAQEEITLPAEVTSVGTLIDWLSRRGQRYEQAFEFIEVAKVFVNDVYALNDQPVKDNDEVVFVPPITGG